MGREITHFFSARNAETSVFFFGDSGFRRKSERKSQNALRYDAIAAHLARSRGSGYNAPRVERLDKGIPFQTVSGIRGFPIRWPTLVHLEEKAARYTFSKQRGKS
jgi:hypothetical protein